uniref:tRNA/rRNA methyltransferase SpoU type domain-containing protein n=1 Tax=Zea mays TaxID=4577 RepID=A0A804LT89_MAIZE
MQDRTGAQYRGGPRWLDWTRHTRFERLFVLVPLFLIPWLLDVNRVQSSQLAHSTFSRSDEPGSPSLQHKAVRTEGPRPVSLPPYPSDRCRIIREQQMEAGLRALGHRYFGGGGGGLGGFAAARATRLRRQRQRRMAAFCSLAVNGDGNGAAGGPVGSGVEVARARRMLHVVLVSPLIPGNTGSIARTCAASAVGLHLVGPLGYKVDDTKLKRAGLDYWPYVVVKIHDSWDHFCDYFMKQEGDKRLLAFTKRGTHIHSVSSRCFFK